MTDLVQRWRDINDGYASLQYAESRWPFVHEVSVLNIAWRVAMYNKTNMRILWEFASDGIEYVNFTASSEALTDYEVINIKSDMIEKTWRSTAIASEWVQWDAGAGQTMGIDTLALLNTNLSQNAVVTLLGYGGGSDAAPGDFDGSAAITIVIDMPTDATEDTVLYCSASAASSATSYRHWKLRLEDPSNAAAYLEIGRLVAGEAFVFDTENCAQDIEFSYKNYKNEVNLNGFTSASNNRALKKNLRLSLPNLNAISQTNYSEWNRMLKYCRDTLKMLVIVDPVSPYRFSVFAKLQEIPAEKTRYVDGLNMYASITATWDEGR